MRNLYRRLTTRPRARFHPTINMYGERSHFLLWRLGGIAIALSETEQHVLLDHLLPQDPMRHINYITFPDKQSRYLEAFTEYFLDQILDNPRGFVQTWVHRDFSGEGAQNFLPMMVNAYGARTGKATCEEVLSQPLEELLTPALVDGPIKRLGYLVRVSKWSFGRHAFYSGWPALAIPIAAIEHVRGTTRDFVVKCTSCQIRFGPYGTTTVLQGAEDAMEQQERSFLDVPVPDISTPGWLFRKT